MALLPCGWSNTLNTKLYITIHAVRCTMRHSRQHHCNKSKMQESRQKKDKPPSRISNRIAKFTRDFSWGKFGFFYSAPNIEILVFHIEGVGCRSPPVNRFENFQIRLIGGNTGDTHTEKSIYY